MTSKPVEGLSRAMEHGLLLRAIESQVIPRLLLTHPSPPQAVPATGETASEAVRPAESEVVGFTSIVLQGSTDEAIAFMRDLHASGISADSIYLDLLAPSARYLGELWTTERSDFVEVTVALHRLQDLAHKFSAYLRGMDDAETVLPAGPRALCVAMPGEQHVFGAQLVGEFLRRARWDVWDAPGATEPDIISLLTREWFTIVGISVSTLDQPEVLAGLVRRVRRASLNPDLRVMVGGLPFDEHPERAALVGADATARDGRDAVVKAQKLLDLAGLGN
jgi:methanogenic corrinoid protein MtbC1